MPLIAEVDNEAETDVADGVVEAAVGTEVEIEEIKAAIDASEGEAALVTAGIGHVGQKTRRAVPSHGIVLAPLHAPNPARFLDDMVADQDPEAVPDLRRDQGRPTRGQDLDPLQDHRATLLEADQDRCIPDLLGTHLAADHTQDPQDPGQGLIPGRQGPGRGPGRDRGRDRGPERRNP